MLYYYSLKVDSLARQPPCLSWSSNRSVSNPTSEGIGEVRFFATVSDTKTKWAGVDEDDMAD
ncbi:hypothetical protein N7453_003929 [Penicillium expansum]|nr:hypothetical protein N7453_003929 [Penicillium expansum]